MVCEMGTPDCDGDYNFGVAAGLTRFSNAFRNVPERIIVGIGYAMETSNGDGYAHHLSIRLFTV